MNRIVISSGHGLRVAGASNIINEVTEARRVVDRVAQLLTQNSVPVIKFHENNATNQTDNVNAIVRYHNSQARDIDVSVHFNAVEGTRDAGIGVEVLHYTGNNGTKATAQLVAGAISKASGLILRSTAPRDKGALASTLGFLRSTNKPAILIEVCFVNSRTDVRLYQDNFEAICAAIATEISGVNISTPSIKPPGTVNISIDGSLTTVQAELLDGSWWVTMPNGRAVMVRDVLVALGYDVSWNAGTQTIIAERRVG
jgi:N-acetylmuramoyl-L-alanine amidase